MKRFTAFAMCIIFVLCSFSLAGCGDDADVSSVTPSSSKTSSESDVSSKENTSSEITSSKKEVSSKTETSSKNNTSGYTPLPKKNYTNGSLKVQVEGAPSWKCSASHNTGYNIDDNVFMDALIYTGYNIEKHRSDGAMWRYVLAAKKKGLGWLSKIRYGMSNTGLETTADHKPDIALFERRGLDCATYVCYVYYNYLPNVAGIDTSCLAKPENPLKAQSVREACQVWESKGLCKQIKFTATGRPQQYMHVTEAEEIPLGSIICFKDGRAGFENSDHCTHVCIYAGYKNNYHWVYHVGNENGPEFCSIERMSYGADPQMILAIFSTPTFIREIIEKH